MVIDPLRSAAAVAAAGERGVMLTCVTGADRGAIAVLGSDLGLLAGNQPPADVATAVAEVLRTGVPVTVGSILGDWFVEAVHPAPRLVVLGAISVADALVPMAAAAGFSVIVIDTRDWLARPERYPAATQVRCGTPVDEMQSVGLDAATAVVSLLHEPRLEDDVLEEALRSPANFVGSMGSAKTSAAKRERLRERGVADVERLRAPIGLPIGARTPHEIAVAVLAEIVAVRRGAA